MNRRKRSSVWLHFKELPKEKGKIAQCVYCKNKYSYEASVSNLKKHLQKSHSYIELNRNESETPEPCESDSETSSLSEQQPGPSGTQMPSCSTSGTSENIPIVIDDTVENSPRQSSHQLGKRKQSTIPIYVRQKMSRSDHQTLDQKVFNLFVKDFQPFSIVEDEGFRDLMEFLAPDYDLPSRKYFSSSMLNSVYESTLESTLLRIAEAPSLCVTTDNWTSRKNHNYICVTAHYISKNFELVKYVLECIQYKDSHSAEDLAAELRRIFQKWKIDDKVLIIVSDNAPNIVKAAKEILKKRHFGCFAHSLNLSVQNALLLKEDNEELIEELYSDDEDEGEDDNDDIPANIEDDNDEIEPIADLNTAVVVIKKTKRIVRYIRKSPQTAQKLEDSQKMLGVAKPLCVIMDVRTRWNSTLQMLERFVKLKPAIRIVFANKTVKGLEMLTEDEWLVAEELVELLKPFEVATVEMSGESYLTASKIIPITDGLKNHILSSLNEGRYINTASAANILLSQLNKRFRNLQRSTTLAACSFLDPRFKHHVFTDKEAFNSIQRQVTDWATALITTKATAAKNNPATEESARKQKETAAYWVQYDKKVEESTVPATNARAAAILEIQKYITAETLPRKECPLKWWKDHKNLFPNLSELFRSKGCMVATSVPCERVFSTTGNFVTPRRARIVPSKVGKLTFLNSNL